MNGDKKLNKKKIISISIVVIALLVLVGFTYGYFLMSDTQTSVNVINSSCLSVSITNDGDAISITDAVAVSDVEGMSNTPYTFTITNSCDTSTNYQINLESINSSSNSLSSSYIKTSIQKESYGSIIKLLGDADSADVALSEGYESHKLYSGVISGGSSISFNLRLWIDYDATADEAGNKTYQSKIVITANSEIVADTEYDITYTIDTVERSGSATVSSTDTVSSILYCTTDLNECTPSDSDISISSNSSNQMVCSQVNGSSEVYCSEPFNYSNSTSSIALSEYLISTASSNGGSDMTLIQHTSGCNNGCAEDGKYRYSGGGTSSTTDVNNYICFGTSDLSTCLADTDTYLFRIIEVDPDDGYVKIIKNTSYGSYYWNSTDGTTSTAVMYGSYYNYWAVGSTLYATLATTLNTTYLNTFSSSWQSLIATYNWNIAGATISFCSSTIKEQYEMEIAETASFKIGLMNTYDFGYAGESTYWTTSGGSCYYDTDSAYKYDWLYSGDYEWTVARYSSDSDSRYAFGVDSDGYVYNFSYLYSLSYVVRPSFYLESTANYVSGSGTSTDPIIIQ